MSRSTLGQPLTVASLPTRCPNTDARSTDIRVVSRPRRVSSGCPTLAHTRIFIRKQLTPSAMLIAPLQRHLAVESREGALRLTRTDRKFWNVISICSPTTAPVHLPDALQVHPMRFEDTELANDPEAVAIPRREDIVAVLNFSDVTAPRPLLVHCQMGLSRSTAVALVLLVRALWPSPTAFEQASEALLEVRPQSRPNSLIARLGFEEIMTPSEARRLAQAVIEHPRFAANLAATSRYATRFRSHE